MAPPSPVLRLNAVPAYVLKKHGLEVTSRTVRYWVSKGKGLETLETRQVKNPFPKRTNPWMMVTTKEWVDQFVARTGMVSQ